MNQEKAKLLLPVIQGLAEGKTVQFLGVNGTWIDHDNPAFNYEPNRYRLKPEPRIFYVILRADGTVANDGLFADQKLAEARLAVCNTGGYAGPYTMMRLKEQL